MLEGEKKIEVVGNPIIPSLGRWQKEGRPGQHDSSLLVTPSEKRTGRLKTNTKAKVQGRNISGRWYWH